MPSINYNNQTARRVPGSQFLYLVIVLFVSREELQQIHFLRMESTPSRHPVSHPLTPSKGVLSCSLLITISKWHWLCLPSKSLLYPIPSPVVVMSGGGGGILPHLMMAISITTMCIHQKCCSSTLRLVGLCYTVNVLLLLFLVLTEQYWKMNSGDEAEKTPPPHPSTSFKAQSLGRERSGGCIMVNGVKILIENGNK